MVASRGALWPTRPPPRPADDPGAAPGRPGRPAATQLTCALVPDTPCEGTALHLSGVEVLRGDVAVLRGLDWVVRPAERWVVLGPNGCGKTTLVQLASGYLHPTRGTVHVLGERLGRTDVRALRRRIALVSASISRMLLPHLSAREVVVSAATGALEPWWDSYSSAQQQRAVQLLSDAGFAHVSERAYGLLSEGERQQVLLARALMAEPDLVLMDEPCAGLDMGGRERLLQSLARFARRDGAPPAVMVTHHVEEVPPGFTHALVMKAGRCLAQGAIAQVLRSDVLSACFELQLELHRDGDRWWSRASD